MLKFEVFDLKGYSLIDLAYNKDILENKIVEFNKKYPFAKITGTKLTSENNQSALFIFFDDSQDVTSSTTRPTVEVDVESISARPDSTRLGETDCRRCNRICIYNRNYTGTAGNSPVRCRYYDKKIMMNQQPQATKIITL